MYATKDDIARIEKKLDLLLGSQSDITEEEFCRRIGRSKTWAKQARNGTRTQPAIFRRADWYSIRGKGIFYKEAAIERIIRQLKK